MHDPERLRADYQRDGFVVHPEPVVPGALLDAARGGMARVLAGNYATAPRAGFERRDPPTPDGLVKIDQAHVVDPDLLAVVSCAELGGLAAAVLQATRVQAWATQLLFKPGGGTDAGVVGWHQDLQYWRPWWTGETFTIWLALDDVDADMGPLSYVRGSHRWGLQGGDFFSQDLEAVQSRLPAEEWDEMPAVLPAGGVSIHQNLTLHGSRQNTSSRPRCGIAVHLRTERAEPRPGGAHPYGPDWLADPSVAPVLVACEEGHVSDG